MNEIREWLNAVEEHTGNWLVSDGNHDIYLLTHEPWGYPPHLNWEPDQDFDKVVNAFEYYNCTNSETGYYAAFYAKVEEQKS